jgi:type I site-specific restriction endonuclease
VVSTESDVEQKILMPLLNGEAYLAVPQIQIRTKEYLAPAKLDKEAGKTPGYFPDYSIWSCGFLVLVVEAKAPRVPVEEGYREASLYARHINQNYPTGLTRIIHVSEDKRSLLCYKHVVETMFAVTKEASECLTIAQHSVCCSREFFANL